MGLQRRMGRREAWDLAKISGTIDFFKKKRPRCSHPRWIGVCQRQTNQARGKRICRGFRCVNAHAEQEGPVLRRRGYCTSIKAPNDYHCGKRVRLKRTKTQQCTSETLDLFVTVQLPEDTPPVLPLAKSTKIIGIHHEWIEEQTPNLIKHGRAILSHTDNYDPIVVLVLSGVAAVQVQQVHQLNLHDQEIITVRRNQMQDVSEQLEVCFRKFGGRKISILWK